MILGTLLGHIYFGHFMETSSADKVATAVAIDLGLLGCLVTLFDAMNFSV